MHQRCNHDTPLSIHRGSIVVELDARLQVGQQRIRCGPRCSHTVVDRRVKGETRVVDFICNRRHGGGNKPLAEVIDLQREVFRGEVDIDTKLRVQRHRDLRFRRIFNRERGSRAAHVTWGFSDVQDGADFGPFHPKAIVVLTIHAFGKRQVILQDTQRFSRDHGDG